MSEQQKMTFEEMEKILDRICGPRPKPKPKVVTSDGEQIRDAEVKVSDRDPNYRESDDGVVKVRRSQFVKINMEVYEAQQQWKREERRHRREIDPARTGIWDNPDDE